MKAKHALFLYAFGLCADAVGALLKIQHYSGADNILLAGTLLKVGGILLLALKLLKHPPIRQFLNS